MDSRVKEQILTVRETGLVNMFDVRGVRRIAEALGLAELAAYLDEDVSGYVDFIYHGG